MKKSLLVILSLVLLTNCQLGADIWRNTNDSLQNPEIMNIYPSNGEIISPLNDLTIIFSKDIDSTTLDSAITITTNTDPGVEISKSITYSSSDLYIATIAPNYGVHATDGASFTVNISNEIKDQQGNHLYSALNYYFIIGVNTSNPKVEITSPDTSEEIQPTRRISFIFSSKIDTGTGEIKILQNDEDITSQIIIDWLDPQNQGQSHILRINPTILYLPEALIEIQFIGLKSPEGLELDGQSVFIFKVKAE